MIQFSTLFVLFIFKKNIFIIPNAYFYGRFLLCTRAFQLNHKIHKIHKIHKTNKTENYSKRQQQTKEFLF